MDPRVKMKYLRGLQYRVALLIAMSAALIGAVCMKYSAAFLVGAVLYKALQNSESSTSIFRICGRNFKDGMIALGGSSAQTIPCVIWQCALSLKRNGSDEERA